MKRKSANALAFLILAGCIVLSDFHISKESCIRLVLKTVQPYCVVRDQSIKDCMAQAILAQTNGLYRVYTENPTYEMQLSDALTWQMLMVEKQQELAKQNEQQNQGNAVSENELKEAGEISGTDGEHEDLQTQEEDDVSTNQQEEVAEENSPYANAPISHFKDEAEKYAYYESLKSYETLVEEFYQIDTTTSIGREELDGQKFLAKDLSIKQSGEQPQILIYHTHSQEGYSDAAPGDESGTVVEMGELLAKELTAYGYHVIHHTGKYDVPSRDYAYANAAAGLEEVLAEYPTVEVIIDLHRDGVGNKTRLVTEVDGKTCAKFMFFNGLCRTKKTGMLEKFPNPNLEDNLALSFQLQLLAKEYYPTLVRRIYLKGLRYNMQYRPKSLLIELGAQTNTAEEARNTIPYIAQLLDMVFRGQGA